MSSAQTMRYIIIPQAFKIIVPALGKRVYRANKRNSDSVCSGNCGNYKAGTAMGFPVLFVLSGIYRSGGNLSDYDAYSVADCGVSGKEDGAG